MEKYKSVTSWNGDADWDISVTYGSFKTKELAAVFGNKSVSTLRFDQRQNKLILGLYDGTDIELNDEQIVVSKLKPEAVGKWMVDDNDYEKIDVEIKEFSQIEGLDGTFGSLSYGVIDEAANPVDIRDISEKIFQRHQQIMREIKRDNYPIHSEGKLEFFYQKLLECVEAKENGQEIPRRKNIQRL